MTSNNLKEESLGPNCTWFIESGPMQEYLEIYNKFPLVLSTKNGIWTFSHYVIMVRSQN